MEQEANQPRQRQRYNVIAVVARQRIIGAYLNGRDFINLATELGIARQMPGIS